MSSPASVYVHIPFCIRRCSYCDFVTYAGMESFFETYTRAVCKEIELVTSCLEKPPEIHTVFFGGGTPSVLPVENLEKILQTNREKFQFVEPVEISLEANPGTLDLDLCQNLRKIGFTRISLGVQSTNQKELELLGRIHTYPEAVIAFQMARAAGFDNINLDLIYGLPGQSLVDWQQSLQTVTALNPEHLSLYSLTVEEGTRLWEQVRMGEIPEPDPDVAADQLEWNCDYLEKEGYRHYEVSNWARYDGDRDLRARHNLQYWINEAYFGFGAGAHSYFEYKRIANTGNIPDYIKSIQSAGEYNQLLRLNQPQTSITKNEQMQDEMMLGLRLLDEGISPEHFKEKFGRFPEEVFGKELENLIQTGLLEKITCPEVRYQLTRRGLMLGNQVFMQFVGDN